MSRTAILLILLLILVCSALAVNAQDVSTVAEKLKAVVKEKAPCWKLFHQQERKDGDRATVEVNWVCGKEGVVIYLYQVSSVEAAAKLLNEILTSPVQSLAVVRGAPPMNSYHFGDESSVRSYLLYSSSSYIFFRKGKIVVRIDSGTMGNASSKRTLRNAVRFAKLFADRMSPPNNSVNRSANSVDFIEGAKGGNRIASRFNPDSSYQISREPGHRTRRSHNALRYTQMR